MVKDIIMSAITIIGFLASLVTLLAVWSNVANLVYNIRHFWKGGHRITYESGEYIIKKEGLGGDAIYSSTDEPQVVYRSMNKLERHECIPPFREWNAAHWTDDIRAPQYTLSLLRK